MTAITDDPIVCPSPPWCRGCADLQEQGWSEDADSLLHGAHFAELTELVDVGQFACEPAELKMSLHLHQS